MPRAGLVVVVLLALWGCGSRATWDYTVVPWDGMAIESICLDVAETWYDVQGDRYLALEDVRDVADLDEQLEAARIEGGQAVGDYPPTFVDLDVFEDALESRFTGHRSGMAVVDSDCDATLRAVVAGVPLVHTYERLEGATKVGETRIFDGALIVGTISLESPGRETLTEEIHGYRSGTRYFDRRFVNGEALPSTPADINLLRVIEDNPLSAWIDATLG